MIIAIHNYKTRKHQSLRKSSLNRLKLPSYVYDKSILPCILFQSQLKVLLSSEIRPRSSVVAHCGTSRLDRGK